MATLYVCTILCLNIRIKSNNETKIEDLDFDALISDKIEELKKEDKNVD